MICREGREDKLLKILIRRWTQMNTDKSFFKFLKTFHHRLGQDPRKYDSKDGIGRVESGTETENNAYVHGWTVVEQCRSYCRGAIVEAGIHAFLLQ